MTYKFEPIRSLKIYQACNDHTDRWSYIMEIWHLNGIYSPTDRETFSLKTYEQAHEHAMKMRAFLVKAYEANNDILPLTRKID